MEGGIKFLHFLSVFFSGKLILSKLRNKNMALGGSGGMLPRKVFKNLDTVMAILELFEQFLWHTAVRYFLSN